VQNKHNVAATCDLMRNGTTLINQEFQVLEKLRDTLREVQDKEDGHHAQVKWQLMGEFGNLQTLTQLIHNSSVHTQECMEHLKAIIQRYHGGPS